MTLNYSIGNLIRSETILKGQKVLPPLNAGSFSSKGRKQVAGAFRWRYETVSSGSQKLGGLRRPLAEGKNIGPFYAELAPTVELLTCNEKVGSSNLSFGTIKKFQNFRKIY